MNSTRTFLRVSLDSGMKNGLVGPADILRHATPDVLASNLPAAHTAKLLKASLAATKMDSALVVDTLGLDVLCEHLPTTVLWACLAEQAGKALGGAVPSRAAPSSSSSDEVVEVVEIDDDEEDDDDEPAAPRAKPQAKVTPASAAAPRAKTAPPPAPGSQTAATGRRDRRPARLKPRNPTASDFDVDTDVGEQWPSQRKSEAERLGAAPVAGDDWQKPEETATKNVIDPSVTRKG